MKLLIATLILSFSFGTFASEKDRSAFPGKYRLSVKTWWGSAEVEEFLLNSKGEMKILNEDNGNEIYEMDFKVLDGFNSFGPELPLGLITGSLGSDEDGISAFAYIAWVGEGGDEELKLVTQFVTYMDGPGNVGDYYTDFLTLEIWDKGKKEYRELTTH